MSSELVIVLITAATSVVSSSGVWAYLQTRSKHNNAEARMIKGIGYTTFMSQCNSFLDRGKITPGEFTELTRLLYEPYKALGGNGSADRVYKLVSNLPMASESRLEEIQKEL